MEKYLIILSWLFNDALSIDTMVNECGAGGGMSYSRENGSTRRKPTYFEVKYYLGWNPDARTTSMGSW
jgi:hypothetical protein